MQYLKKINQSQRKLHLFGSCYSHHTGKQAFFNNHSPSPKADSDNYQLQVQEENRRLKMQLNEVKKILQTILNTEKEEINSKEEKNLMDLLEELLQMVLAKSEQNFLLKQRLQEMHVESIQQIDSKLSLFSYGKQQSHQSSQKNINTTFNKAERYLRSEQESEGQVLTHKIKTQNSEIRQKYWPKVLFSIGKEVKTINKISSNNLFKNNSLHSYSKSSSQENSFKDLMHLKKNRLSIDKSIYIQSDKEVEPHFSVQNSSRTINSKQNVTKNNIGNVCSQLAPIKQERFSDKYSEINCSKIKAANVSFVNGDRFTFESTNTDPSSYNSRHY